MNRGPTFAFSTMLVALHVGCSVSEPSSPAASIAPSAVPTAVNTPQTPADRFSPTPPSADISGRRLQPGEVVPFWALDMLTGDTGWGTAAWHVFRTEDGGRGWQDVTPPDAQLLDRDKFYRAYASFPNPMSAWVALIAPSSPPELIWVWTTSDGGRTWDAGSPIEPLPGVELHAMLRALDETAAWLLVDSVVEATADVHIARLYRTLDGGASWTEASIPTKRPADMEFLDGTTGFIAEAIDPDEGTGLLLWVTRDGGTSWEATTILPPPEDPALFERHGQCNRIDLSVTEDLWVALLIECLQPDRALYRSSDGGGRWDVVPLPLPSGGVNPVLWFDAHRGLQLGLNMYRTVDGGDTWTKFKIVNWTGNFSFADPQSGWAIADAGPRVSLVHTEDSGATWDVLHPRIVPAASTPLSDLDTTLANPAPLGQPVEFFNTLLITVTNVVLPADGLVSQASPVNAPPSAGSQFVLADMSIECTTPADGTCIFFDNDLVALMDERGATYGAEDEVVGLDLLSLRALDPGETIQGSLVFQSPTDASGLALIFSRFMWGEAYFALR